MAIKRATRERVRLRMALDGPSGSGKTYTSLLFATAIARAHGGKIGLIDSERGRASNYADFPLEDGVKLEFDVAELSSYSPSAYVSAINEFEKAGVYSVLVIDSLSQAWAGEGGALEQKDAKGGNSYTAWAEITPMQNRLVSALVGCQQHLICTMRSKTAYVLEPNDKGKMVPHRVGLEPIQRKGIEYEFSIYGSIDLDHRLRITKSDCQAVDGASVLKPDVKFMDPVIEWMKTGVAVTTFPEAERIAQRHAVDEFLELMSSKFGQTRASLEEEYYKKNNHEIWHAPAAKIAEKLASLKKTQSQARSS